MALSDCLREKISAIAERWQSSALATYPEASCRAFQRERDPFANPVGHALRRGTRAVLDGIVEGRGAREISSCLDEIIKMRAVQGFEPSQALGFVFSLKEVIRAELGREDPALAFLSELADLERRIDQIALGVFDIYMRYRGQICELRINEVKRIAGQMADRRNRRSPPPESEEDLLPPGASDCAQVERGGGR